MPQVQPFRALHYDLSVTDGLQPVVSPPYDVIDAEQRERLAGQSPYNAVRIDLPQTTDGSDIYAAAAQTLGEWIQSGGVVRDAEPALWVLEQDYTGPDGRARTRRGFLARVQIEAYGPGRVRPHERTHPGPKQDRLNLTRATHTNLSPIFALFDDPDETARVALETALAGPVYGRCEDPDGTRNRLTRVTDPALIEPITAAASASELLIADGHHRYETARVYAEETGGVGASGSVLMCLVALQDPGLTIFPTHRLVKDLTPEQHERLAQAIRRDWDITELDDPTEMTPHPKAGERPQIGYIDAHSKRPYRLTLKPGVDLGAIPDSLRSLDTAITESLLLLGALGMTEDDIDHLTGLGYSRNDAEALEMIERGGFDAGFFMGFVPVTKVQSIAEAGTNMPPKSTYFFPKVPTGLLFNPLSD